MVIPEYGLVLGNGALASALVALLETAAGGALVGATIGVLQRHGLPDADARTYDEEMRSGGVLMSLTLPFGMVDGNTAGEVVSRLGAREVRTYPEV